MKPGKLIASLSLIFVLAGIVHAQEPKFDQKKALEALESSSEYKRQVAAEFLAKLGDANAVEAVVRHMHNDPSIMVRKICLNGLLGRRDKTLVPEFIKVLSAEDTNLRQKAVHALGELRTDNGYKALLKMLEDEAPEVRVAAVRALARFAKNETLKEFEKLFADEDTSVRRAAVEGICEIGTDDTVGPLISALENSDSFVVRTAVEKLGKLGAKKAVPGIIKILEHENSSVRAAAAKALGLIGDPSAMEALLKLLKDENDEVRRAAIPPMAAIGANDLADHLIPLLDDPDHEIREAALNALIKLEVDSDTFKAKLRLMAKNEPHSRIREKAKRALKTLEQPAQQDKAPSFSRQAFGWRPGDWWVITRVAIRPAKLGIESVFHFYFKVAERQDYHGQKAFVVKIYCRDKKAAEQYIALRKSGQALAWPDGLEQCRDKDLVAGFPLVAKLYVAREDYSALGIEYSDCVKQRKPEGSLNDDQERLKKKGLIRLYHIDIKHDYRVHAFSLCYPNKDDPLDELIVRAENPEGPSALYRRYLLLEDELWIYKQEDLRKNFYADRLVTRGFFFISETSRNGENDSVVSLNPSLKPENVGRSYTRQNDKRSISVFELGSGFKQVGLDEYLKKITSSEYPGFDSLSNRGLSVDPGEKKKLREKVERLLAQEPPFPEDESKEQTSVPEEEIEEKLPPVGKPKPAIQPAQEKSEQAVDWIVIGVAAGGVVLAGVVILLILRRVRSGGGKAG